MIYLIFAVISSATLAIVLKIFSKEEGNRYGLIIGNYLTCVLISFILIPNKNLIISPDYRTVICSLIGGVFFVLGLVSLQQSIKVNGASLSSAFGKLGILVSLSTGILVFGERPSLLQGVGMIAVLAAIVLINLPSNEAGFKQDRSASKISLGLLMITLLFGGLGDSMAKVFERVGKREEDTLYFFYLFLVALVISLVLGYRETRVAGKGILPKEFFSGILAGVPNYFSSYLLLSALIKIPAFVVYSIFSTGTILLVTIVSILFFGERLTKSTAGAMALIVLALVLLQ